MYAVYLIDDEPWALKIIENGFPWAKYGFRIVGKSQTVDKALQEVPVLGPDVVFTDIRIAGENGISLIRKLRSQNLNTLFIIVTGYDDFDIAHAAIKLDVFDLLLKPVDLDEAETLLQRLQAQLNDRQRPQKSGILEELESMSAAACIRQYSNISANFPIRAVFVQGSSEEPALPLSHKPLLVLKPAQGQLLFIFEQYAGFEAGLLKQLSDLYPGCCIGVSEAVPSNAPILLPIGHAKMISCQSFFTGQKGLFVYSCDHYKSVLQLADELLSAQTAYTTDELFKIWIKEDYHLEDLAYLVRCLSRSSKVVPITNYQDLLGSYRNARELAQQLLADLAIQKVSPVDKLQLYQQLLKLIHERFTQDISLSQLAQELNVSTSYLSEIFTQQQGISFSKYLKHLRNARACDLLRGTQISIQDVAELSGFNDYFYFCKQFKNEFGVTPKQYRSQKG